MRNSNNQERVEKYTQPLPKNFKRKCINGADYQVYEIGRGHILVSKNNRLHIKFEPRPNGCLCFYIWQNHKWTPKCKYESVPYIDVCTDDKILKFMSNNPITL